MTKDMEQWIQKKLFWRVVNSKNRKQAEQNVAIYGAELIREIKEYTINKNGSISYK